MRYSTILALMVAIMIPLMGADGCGAQDQETSETTQEQREQTQEMVGQAHDKVGMPQITEYSERRLLKRIMELRDGMISSHTYLVDFQNNAKKLCRSMGYGLPYGVQYVNPQKMIEEDHGPDNAVIPQADPNGLFSPRNVNATWVNCVTKDGGQKPVYTEEMVITSPVPLDELQGSEFE